MRTPSVDWYGEVCHRWRSVVARLAGCGAGGPGAGRRFRPYLDFAPPPCLAPEVLDEALPPDATDWLLPLAPPPLLPADEDFAPLASCTLLLPPFLPAWVGLLMMCSDGERRF